MGGGRRHREEEARKRARRRRLLRAGAVVVVAGAGVAALAVSGRIGGSGADPDAPLPPLRRLASERVDDPRQAVTFTEPPDQYLIDYRVRYRSGTENIERLAVRRPFESRTEIFIGRPAKGNPDQVRETAFGTLVTQSGKDEPVTTAAAPAMADGDVRPEPALDGALDSGVLERRERRRVAGRLCTVYRGGGAVAGGVLQAPTARDYTDICLDANGLALETWQVIDGRAAIQKVAARVVVGAEAGIGDGTFEFAGRPVKDGDRGAGSVGEIEPGSAPEGPAFALDTPPDGFTLRGRYAVVPAQAALANPMGQGEAVAGIADVWVRGVDFVVVDQSGRLDGSAPFTYAPESPRVDLAPLAAEGEARHGLRGNEVRALLDGGRTVRVYGTLPMEELAAIARRLRSVTATGLKPR